MLLELIAIFVFGFAAAGVVMLINRLTGRRLPRWLTPVAAGAAMIGIAIFSEYSWFGRTADALPEGVILVSTNESRAVYRPWTYVFPMVDRFAAVDTTRALRNDAVPDTVILPMVFLARWMPGHEIPIAVDCAESRRAQLADGIGFGADGTLQDAEWIDVDETDAVVAAVCA